MSRRQEGRGTGASLRSRTGAGEGDEFDISRIDERVRGMMRESFNVFRHMSGAGGAAEGAGGSERRRRRAAEEGRTKALEELHLSMSSFWQALGRIADKEEAKRTPVEELVFDEYKEMYEQYERVCVGVHSGMERERWMDAWVHLNHDMIDMLCGPRSRIMSHASASLSAIFRSIRDSKTRAAINQEYLDPESDAEEGLRRVSPFRDHEPPPPHV